MSLYTLSTMLERQILKVKQLEKPSCISIMPAIFNLSAVLPDILCSRPLLNCVTALCLITFNLNVSINYITPQRNLLVKCIENEDYLFHKPISCSDVKCLLGHI